LRGAFFAGAFLAGSFTTSVAENPASRFFTLTQRRLME
jgi:hypothetical protein